MLIITCLPTHIDPNVTDPLATMRRDRSKLVNKEIREIKKDHKIPRKHITPSLAAFHDTFHPALTRWAMNMVMFLILEENDKNNIKVMDLST